MFCLQNENCCYSVVATINDTNYQGIANSTLTINQAPLTAKADDKAKVQGAVNPHLTIIYTGFVHGEGDSVLDTLPPISTTTTTSSSPVGTYPTMLSGGSDNNYTLTLQNGTLPRGRWLST